VRPGPTAIAGYAPAAAVDTVRANRWWWDDEASAYLAEHGSFLGRDRFVWGPEGLDEAEAHLLGDVGGRRVLEVGSGAAQCGAWLAGQGAEVVAVDLSGRMLAAAVDRPGLAPVQADARRLPLAAASVDLACSAYGALPFVADVGTVFAEVARVLRPGGRWVFSVTHPIRWAFPDDPGPPGLTAVRRYFDRTPYSERDTDGRLVYAEHHRTLGDWVRELTGAGFRLLDLVEPEWPDWNENTWGGWSRLRGELIPGTAVFVTTLPETASHETSTVPGTLHCA
jgi:SAM-dependent methyltransferase